MGLFTKKVPVIIAAAGKCRAKLSMQDEQAKTLLKKMLPQIIETQMGNKAAQNPKYLLSFREWSSKEWYSPELVRTIGKNGFNVFGMSGDEKRMADDIDQAVLKRFDKTLDSYHPVCFLFPEGDPLYGVFLLLFELKVKETSLK